MAATPSVSSIGLIVQSVGDSQSMHIPISIESVRNKNAKAKALINSGAAGYFIDWGFVRKNLIPTYSIPNPILVWSVDSTANKSGNITKACDLYFSAGGWTMQACFLVTTLGGEEIILGLLWLQKENPDIDWERNTMTLAEDPITAWLLALERAIHLRQQPHVEEVEEEPEKVFFDASDEELWDPSEETLLGSPPDLLPCEEEDHEDLDEIMVSYCHREPLLRRLDFEKPLTDEHNPPTFTFKTKNRTISWVLNSPQFIFNSAIGINKVLALHELATQAAAGKKAKMFEEIVPQVFHSFRDVFDKAAMDGLPPKWHYDHQIRLKDEDKFEGKRAKIYPLSQDQEKELDTFIDKHLTKGTIVPSESPQASSFFFIKKKDGSLCLVQDYHFLNSHTIKNAYPLPHILDLFDQLKDAKIFTKMDIRWGYNNVQIHKADCWKAAFNTKRGLFEPTVMFFGLCNSPAMFQAMMNNIFADYIADGWLVIYMDNLLIFSADKTIHEERTRKVLQWLCEQELSLKPEKCVFNSTKVEYLRMIIRPREISMDKMKLDGVINWPTLTTLKQVCSFLGFANFYRKFIAGYSNVARPLSDLTKKDVPSMWSSECQHAFNSLKHSFISAPILQMPDKDKPFILAVDASLYATGGVLMQKDSNGDLHPCSYLSQSLSLAEHNYQIYDRELLAIIRALDTWHHYLQGSPFPIVVHTNHKNLTYWWDPQQLTSQQLRWQLKLSEYDLILQHIAGWDLVVSDALSRRVDHAPDDEPSELQYMFPPTFFRDEELPPIRLIWPGLHERLRLTSEVDTVVQMVVDTLNNSSLSPMQQALSDWKWEDGLLMFKGHYYVLPGPVQGELIAQFHNAPTWGHPGWMKTQELISCEYWWPGLPTFVKKYVEGCAMCQQNKVNTHPTQPPLVPILAPLWGTPHRCTDIPRYPHHFLSHPNHSPPFPGELPIIAQIFLGIPIIS